MDSPPGSAAYLEHTAHIDGVLNGLTVGSELAHAQVDGLLDGHSAAELRRLVPLSYRRQVGAFFTPGHLKARVAGALQGLHVTSILDPTCGAGDLLLAATEHLPLGPTIESTVSDWGQKLHGWDLHDEFVQVARRRLFLAALRRHYKVDRSFTPPTNPLQYFSKIYQADARSHEQAQVDTVVLNPPFTRVDADRDCSWARGKTSHAAIMFLHSLRHLESQGHMVAILPDSLRSGSNFAKWRSVVEERVDVMHVERLGVFDEYTDIDVFLLVAQLRDAGPAQHSATWWNVSTAKKSVGDLFQIGVGTVVDNRDPHEGVSRPFLVARDLPNDTCMNLPARRRQFEGRLFKPPFVAIRRTSRPSDSAIPRAAGVLVTGAEEIAVDNHLLVAKPFKGGIKACRTLIRILSSQETTEMLDDRISCRHLTVSAVKEIPWSI